MTHLALRPRRASRQIGIRTERTSARGAPKALIGSRCRLRGRCARDIQMRTLCFGAQTGHPPESGCSTATSADFRASALQIAKQFAGIKAAEALYPPAPCPSRTERHRAAACPRSPWLSSGRLGRALVPLVASAEPVAGLFGWSPVDPGRQKHRAQDSMKRQPSNYSATNCLGTQSNL